MAAGSAAKKPRKRTTKVTKATPKSAVARKAVVKKAAGTGSTPRKAPKPRAAASKKAAAEGVVTPADFGSARRATDLAHALGGVTALARAVGVSPSQTSRWSSGKERPSPEMAKRLIDLDHVVARAGLVWDPEVIPIWLRSANGFLGGQTPLGVTLTRGPSEVVSALDAYDAGGFA